MIAVAMPAVDEAAGAPSAGYPLAAVARCCRAQCGRGLPALPPLPPPRCVVGFVLPPSSWLLLLGALGCASTDGLDPLDRDHDGWVEPWDCDDLDPKVHPDATEVCDGVDNDCDGTADGTDAADAVIYYPDADGDGAGADDSAARSCGQPTGFVSVGGDCDDADPDIGPDADERCDGIDNDCDLLIDETDAVDTTTWYLDQDGDGFGNPAITTKSCDLPDGYAADPTDCDDADATINPDAIEVCDPVDADEDCDGLADEDDPDADGLIAWYLDADGDGFGIDADDVLSCEPQDGRSEYGGDCDDADDGVHPGAAELCGNGVDDDCDGRVDGADDDAVGDVVFYADADLDGYGDPDMVVGSGCDSQEGWSSLPTDCDDGDASVHPGAAESWYDGVDQDCDGDDVDADGDGYAGDAAGGPDCDDAAPDVHPGATERCDNGIDDDCDGVVDPCATDLVLWSNMSGDRAGIAVAAPGDVDGDGDADFVLGADHAGAGGAGAVWLVSGPVSVSVELDATASLTGDDDGDHLGLSVAGGGDLDGDGLADVVLGAPDASAGGSGAGVVYVVSGPLSAGGSVGDLAWASLVGEDADDRAGSAVATAGDVDGDGQADLLVGADSADPAGERTGAAYLLLGPLSGGELDLWFADARWVGEEPGDEAGAAVAGVGDVDGDGLDDAIIGAPQQRGDGDWPGAAYLLAGSDLGASGALTDATAILRGEASGDRAGEAVAAAGDVDGDGHADLFVGAPERDLGGSGSGAAYVVLGPVSGSHDLGSADLVIEGATPEDRAGSAVLGGLDLDADGRTDLVVGASSDDAATSDGGALYLLLAPEPGSLDLSEAPLRLDAAAEDQGLGASLAGFPDGHGLLVGLPHDPSGGDDAGAAWLLPGW